MKTLIIQALNDAYLNLNKRTPQTKKDTKSISIMDVNPLELTSFMKDNNIPDDAYFDISYSEDSIDDNLLSWDIDIETTSKDKLTYNRRVFSTIAHKSLYDLVITNGYKRKGFNSGLLRDFDDTTVYDMYISNDFDRLVKYYSLSFIKE